MKVNEGARVRRQSTGVMEGGANKKRKKRETDGGFLLSNSEPTC